MSDARPLERSPAVSIVLVSWNAASVLPRCLAALAGSPHEVIVVDNASADGSADLVAERFPWVRLVRETANLGFAGGVNAGLRASHGDAILLLNCDAVPHAGAIERMHDVLASRVGCGAVGAALIDESGRPQHGFHVRRFPTLTTLVVDLWLIDKLWPGNPVTRRYLAQDLTAPGRGVVAVDQPAAACLMVRRDVLEELGGLDERFYPAWFEDVDLCRRIAASGRDILFVPDAQFTHRGGEAMRALGLDRFTRIWYRNLQRYVSKHHGRAALLACKALVTTGMLLRIAVVVARGRWRDAGAYGHVLLDTLTHWT